MRAFRRRKSSRHRRNVVFEGQLLARATPSGCRRMESEPFLMNIHEWLARSFPEGDHSVAGNRWRRGSTIIRPER
jgi:hypothetical protein